MLPLAFSWIALGHESLQVLIWIVTSLLLLVGLVGTVLPMLPGPVLILVAAIFHVLAIKDPGTGWVGLVVLAILVVLAHVVEFFSSAVGAKYFGSTKWGIWGAITGGIVGLFFSIPGLILGPLVGALVFELAFARKQIRPAAKSTWGTLVGTTAGLILKTAIGIAMVGWFLLDELWLKW